MHKNIFFILMIILSSIIISSCNKRVNNSSKLIDFNIFSIEIPSNWNKIEVKGIDSFVGGFLTSTGDTITFDYGKHVSKIDQVINVSHVSEKRKLDSLGFPVNEMFFSKTPDIDKNQGVFHDEYYYYKVIDNRLSKIQVPKQIGKGITKIYFDNLNEKGNNLTIVGRSLDTISQSKLIKTFNTIKIKLRTLRSL